MYYTEPQTCEKYKWAYVSLSNNGGKEKIPTKDIFKFNPLNYDKNKKYYISIGGVSKSGVILFLEGINN